MAVSTNIAVVGIHLCKVGEVSEGSEAAVLFVSKQEWVEPIYHRGNGKESNKE